MKKLLTLAVLLFPLLAFGQSQGTAVRALDGYGTNTLFFHNGVPTRQVANMFAGFLEDYPNGNLSVDWFNRKLYDGTVYSMDWFNRTFNGTAWIFLSVTNHSDVSSGPFATGNVWGYDGLTGKWTNGPPTIYGSGSVTSVAQTVPGQFQVTGSPITTSGTFAMTLTNATGVSNSPIVLKTNATVSGLTKTGFTTNKNVAASSLMGVDANQVETNIIVGAGLSLSGGVLSATVTNQPALTNAITFTFDGATAVVPTNLTRYVTVPYNCTITGFYMLADTTGTTVIDVMRCTFTQFDAGSTHPVIADHITASLPPTITSNKTNVTSVGTWSASLTNGNVLAFRTITNTAATTISLSLIVEHAP